ncbi:hypothetical protein FOMPIDRAFT_1055247 [Fomitopsis schrenkii]|uniref:Uncharacterized protein n=1 Tax=Fomitopsis schrenkii TaxID=2126942 RepID=S8DNS4_FOMSC|nr:hypothetical protein FOMPIDRAFT_1055247 [Fomitopsis schrenkii]
MVLAFIAAQELGDVALVPFNEWALRMETLLVSGESEVDLRLLRWFKKLSIVPQDAFALALNFPSLSVTRATQLCPELLEMAQLGANDVKGWLDYWRGIGFV